MAWIFLVAPPPLPRNYKCLKFFNNRKWENLWTRRAEKSFDLSFSKSSPKSGHCYISVVLFCSWHAFFWANFGRLESCLRFLFNLDLVCFYIFWFSFCMYILEFLAVSQASFCCFFCLDWFGYLIYLVSVLIWWFKKRKCIFMYILIFSAHFLVLIW